MKKSKSRLIRSNKGQGVLEYVIITSLVGIFCLVAIKGFGERLGTRINKMNEKVVEHMEID